MNKIKSNIVIHSSKITEENMMHDSLHLSETR